MYSKNYKIFELVIIFVITPLMMNYFRSEIKHFMILLTFCFFFYCFLILFFDVSFDRNKLGYGPNKYSYLKIIGKRFLIGSPLLFLALIFLYPELLFDYSQKTLFGWVFFIICYPLFSVYPQEVIFRTFIFQRYKDIIKSNIGIIIFSSVSFGFAHIIYGNWIAVVLSCLGGFLFAKTYNDTESTVFSSIEHILWGDLIFALGLGSYFLSQAIT